MNKQFSRVGKIVPGTMSKLYRPVTRIFAKAFLGTHGKNSFNCCVKR